MLRIISIFFLILAIIALSMDIWHFVNHNVLVLESVGQRWYNLHPTSLQQFEPLISRYVAPGVWQGTIQPILQAPAAIVFFVISAIFIGLARLLTASPFRR